MPATLTGDLLGIECVFSDGSAARFELDGLPCPELARDLLTGLAELIHPHGTVDSAGLSRALRAICATHDPQAGCAGVYRRGSGPAPPAGG